MKIVIVDNGTHYLKKLRTETDQFCNDVRDSKPGSNLLHNENFAVF